MPIHEIDGGLGIGSVEQVRRHRRFHRVEKLRHFSFDVGHVVERNSDKLQRLRPVIFVDLHEVGKLVATRIAKRGPEVHQQRLCRCCVSKSLSASVSIGATTAAVWRGFAAPLFRFWAGAARLANSTHKTIG